MVKKAKLSLAKKKIVQKIVDKAKKKASDRKAVKSTKLSSEKKPAKSLLGKRSASTRSSGRKPELKNKSRK